MFDKDLKYIRDSLSKASLLEQLAEEATELAKASLKYARILRGENPTPVTTEEAMANLREELTDVVIVEDVLNLAPDLSLYENKLNRWTNRIKHRKGRSITFILLDLLRFHKR